MCDDVQWTTGGGAYGDGMDEKQQRRRERARAWVGDSADEGGVDLQRCEEDTMRWICWVSVARARDEVDLLGVDGQSSSWQVRN